MAACLRRAIHGNSFSRFWTSSSFLPLHSFLRVGQTVSSIWSLRLFSNYHVRSAASEHLLAKQEDQVARRAKNAAYQREYALRHKQGPEYLTRKRKSDRISHTRHGAKIDSNQRRQQQRETVARRRQTDPAFKLRSRMHNLVLTSAWVRELLPWRTHTPILYPEKVEHTCAKCLVTRHSGFKMWWKRKTDLDQDDNEIYLCHKCYFTGSEAMPEGYEDIEEPTIKTLKSRKIGLDGPDSMPATEKKTRKTTTTKMA